MGFIEKELACYVHVTHWHNIIQSYRKTVYACVRSKQNVRDNVEPPEVITQGFVMPEKLNNLELQFTPVFTREDISSLPILMMGHR